MSKPVIHFQIPMSKSGLGFLFSYEMTARFLKCINEKIGDRYDIIASPMTVDVSDSDNVMQVKVITMDDVRKLLGENNKD